MNYLMMSEAELADLRRRARRGWVMFGIGAGALVVSAFCLGYHTGKQRTYEQASAALDLMLTEQKALNAHIGKMQSETLVERKLLLDAASTIRQRDELVRYNQENVCPDLQKATASRRFSLHPKE